MKRFYAVVFGPDSMVKVGGSFIATTAPITPDFGAGAAWQFTGLPPLATGSRAWSRVHPASLWFGGSRRWPFAVSDCGEN